MLSKDLFEVCSCGEYVNTEDLSISEINKKTICPKCSTNCPNCGRLVALDEILFTKKCCYCDDLF